MQELIFRLRNRPGHIGSAYCTTMNHAVYTITGGNRSDLMGDLNARSFSGEAVETYIGFISEDGRVVSVSIFTVEVLVS
ncbi:MAG: DUF6266 family protein [Ginsengibacter sp.]